MAKNDNLTDFLKDVADAIREKKGSSDLINPQDFSAEIASIQSGGGAVAVSAKAVNFRDYDGTILHSYTKDEFLALSEFPPLPTREGLICQEWNWDFADAVEYVTEYGVLEVGATYITDDGKTRLYITIAAEGRMDVPLYFYQSMANGVTINWGDGSAAETLSSTGDVNTTHHYNAIGDYVISLELAAGCNLRLGHNSSAYCVMGKLGNAAAYCNMLRKAEIGERVQYIGGYAFSSCYSLASVVISKAVESIYMYAFSSCYSFASVVIPKESKGFNANAFAACYSLASVVVPKKVSPFVKSLFFNCRCLNTIVIPEGLSKRVVETSNFENCYSLVSIVFPKDLTSISSQAFASCYSMAFYDFSALESIPSLSTTNAFNNIPSDCKIIVPDALYDTWIAATNWSTYASYIIKKSEWDSQNA